MAVTSAGVWENQGDVAMGYKLITSTLKSFSNVIQSIEIIVNNIELQTSKLLRQWIWFLSYTHQK